MSAQNFAHKITSKRDAHKKKPLLIRLTFAVAGFVLFIPGVPLLVIFPEAGIPLVLFGLALLSFEFTWAGIWLTKFARVVDAVIRWYRNLPRIVRYCIEAFFVVLTIWLIYLLIR